MSSGHKGQIKECREIYPMCVRQKKKKNVREKRGRCYHVRDSDPSGAICAGGGTVGVDVPLTSGLESKP